MTHMCTSEINDDLDIVFLPVSHQAITSANANWTIMDEVLNQESNIFIQENAFENVVHQMVAILSTSQCVNAAVWWDACCR